MTKKELVAAMAIEMGMSKAQTEVVFKEVFDTIKSLLTKGETVSIPGFGKFIVSETKARKGRNPQTGEPLDIPAKNRVSFKPAKDLKESVN